MEDYFATSYHDRITVAVYTAPSVAPFDEYIDEYAAPFVDLPDDAMLPHFPEVTEVEDGNVLIKNVSEFHALVDALWHITGIFVNFREMKRVITHENQHANAARRLGAKNCLFGFSLEQTDDTIGINSYFTEIGGWDTTKLGFAAMLLHPRSGLDYDIKDAAYLGYPGGVRQVGGLILAHNAQLAPGDLKLPMPLSYSRAK